MVNASGLGRPGLLVSQEIEAAVKNAAAVLVEAELERDLAEVLGLTVDMDGEARGIRTIAALLLTNACLLHRRLCDVPHMGGLANLNAVDGSQDPRSVLTGAWHAILKRDYAPVFEPALAVMEALPFNRAVMDAVRSLAECANRLADSLSELGYDHAGPLYHRILGSAKSDGAFYTRNVSAVLLAHLALSPNFADWSDPEAVAKLRIMDPACGTGTLLMAALQAVKGRVREATGEAAPDPVALHKTLVEKALHGLDINRHGVQLAACNLTLGAPTVDYRRMNLYTVKHGPQPDGTVAAGSLEVLRGEDLFGVVQHLPAEHVNRNEDRDFPQNDLDLVIMNPPFTANDKLGRKYGAEGTRRMQQHELAIRDAVLRQDYKAGNLIDANSIGTFFVPMADTMLKTYGAGMAMINPVAAVTRSSGVSQRCFLSERFHIERVVVSHDPKQINFSENTDIHECLIVCRRFQGAHKPPTEFVSLRRMPANAEEAFQAADAMIRGDMSKWGRACLWPAERIEAGDWTPAQWYDGQLSAVVLEIEASPWLEPIGSRYRIGPGGRRFRDAFRQCAPDEDGAVPGFHSVSSRIRRTLRGEPDVWYQAKEGREQLAERYLVQRSHLMFLITHRTDSARLTVVWSPIAAGGSGWTQVAVADEDKAQALAAWWNSTPGKLMLFNRRTRTLTYPQWSLEHMREIRIPNPDNPGWSALKSAYDKTCDMEILPMKQAMEDPARTIIDAAAAKVLGLEEEIVADWRLRLSREPTVTNRPAPE